MLLEFPDEKRISLSDHGDKRGLALENNQWGRRRNDAQGSQSTWYDADSRHFGWNWEWTTTSGTRVTSYPEVMFGFKPWSRRETLGCVRDLKALAVDYAFETSATGGWNAMFEMWLTRAATAHEDEITAEIMVWVARDADGAIRPAGGKAIKKWPDKGISLHEERPLKRPPIYTFALDEAAYEGRIDLRWYLDALLGWSRIRDSDYVASVEFGNETINGKGGTIVRQFDVTLAA